MAKVTVEIDTNTVELLADFVYWLRRQDHYTGRDAAKHKQASEAVRTARADASTAVAADLAANIQAVLDERAVAGKVKDDPGVDAEGWPGVWRCRPRRAV
jgi:hypothetical protein